MTLLVIQGRTSMRLIKINNPATKAILRLRSILDSMDIWLTRFNVSGDFMLSQTRADKAFDNMAKAVTHLLIPLRINSRIRQRIFDCNTFRIPDLIRLRIKWWQT